jgi:hypothetical protein
MTLAVLYSRVLSGMGAPEVVVEVHLPMDCLALRLQICPKLR